MTGPFQALTDQQARELAQALLDAFNKTRGSIDAKALAAALKAGNLDGILSLLGIDNGRHIALEDALQPRFLPALSETFTASALRAALAIGAAWNKASAAASRLFNSVRDTLTGTLSTGSAAALSWLVRAQIKRGTDPLQAARRVVSAVGLTTPQARSLDAYSRALEAVAMGKTPSLTMLRALTAAQRSAVRRAAENGIDLDQADAMTERHRLALLEHRARALGDMEARRLAHAGEHAAWARAIETGQVQENEVRRFWVDMGDERVRHDHRQVKAMNPQGVAFDEPFKTPLGSVMWPPLEINCRCRVHYRRAADG